jgi:hypothetical protein
MIELSLVGIFKMENQEEIHTNVALLQSVSFEGQRGERLKQVCKEFGGWLAREQSTGTLETQQPKRGN